MTRRSRRARRPSNKVANSEQTTNSSQSESCYDVHNAKGRLRLTVVILPPRRALGRIGSAYIRKEDYDNGIKYLNKSLTEHRTPDILAKLKDAERQQAEKTRLAYIDPAKAEAAREQGNVAFKAGDFAKSVEHYGEAIKRNPSDPKGYSNRAAALTKLMALPEALKDADKAIEVDPTFGELPLSTSAPFPPTCRRPILPQILRHAVSRQFPDELES